MSYSANPSRRRRSPQRTRNILIAVGAFFVSAFLCVAVSVSGLIWFVNTRIDDAVPETDLAQSAPTWASDSAELTIAASPLMAPVLEDLATRFNSQDVTTPDGQPMSVRVVTYSPEKMVDAALDAPEFQAISPDSSLWLDRLEKEWAAMQSTEGSGVQIPIGQGRVGERLRYAVSPVVIVAWETVARELGWPEQAIGWQDIQAKATADPDFKWNHPSTSHASGLLATLAEFYAGAGLTRGLTAEAVTDPATLDYVRAVESTVRFYGEGEDVILERLATEGPEFLDAFVAQERVVVDWNRSQDGERLVAIYPAEGALWTDHPLALIEADADADPRSTVTANQRLAFQEFARFLGQPQAQQRLLEAGYRPADLSIALDAGDSPFANTDAVDWREPQTTLQMPPPAVIDVIQNFWYYTKRPTNVYLVVDTSGSMEGPKIERTREALRAFVEEIKGDRDQVGLLEFASVSKSFTPLRAMDDGNRRDLLAVIDDMEAFGGTALIDAVHAATADLIANGDDEAINAIVVMTDGQENESYYGLAEVQALLSTSQFSSPPVIFTIAFGDDADEGLMVRIAEIGEGQFRRADETDIEELYKVISTYF